MTTDNAEAAGRQEDGMGADVFDSLALVKAVIPDVEGRIEQFSVGAMELDAELMEAFIDQLRENISGSKVALEAGDMERVAGEAHSIKGMGGSVGAPEVSVLALDLEGAAKAEDAARCRVLIDALSRWVSGFSDSQGSS